MSRLTQKGSISYHCGDISTKEYSPISDNENDIIDKLGKLEDILEEYGIEDLIDLKISLDYYNHRYDSGVYTERVGKNEQH